ncbi:MAG: hypothetical protein KAI29_25500, partial [Cyclobacteriaceae bacterium]|nr:hypothetical protein [Cyclobacteriaceae bacterium]
MLQPYFRTMFVRKLRNRSGSYSIQIISKTKGKYKVVRTIGSSKNEQELQRLEYLANQEISKLSSQASLFVFHPSESLAED